MSRFEPDAEKDVRDLVAAVDRMTETLVERFVSREEWQRHRRNVRIALGFSFAAFLLVLLSLLGLRDVAETNRELVDDLAECTTPTPPDEADDPHECYEEGQTRQAAALETIFETLDSGLEELGDRIVAEIRAAS